MQPVHAALTRHMAGPVSRARAGRRARRQPQPALRVLQAHSMLSTAALLQRPLDPSYQRVIESSVHSSVIHHHRHVQLPSSHLPPVVNVGGSAAVARALLSAHFASHWPTHGQYRRSRGQKPLAGGPAFLRLPWRLASISMPTLSPLKTRELKRAADELVFDDNGVSCVVQQKKHRSRVSRLTWWL